MKIMCCISKLFIVTLFTLAIPFQSFSQIGSHIPTNRILDWKNPGVEGVIPPYAQNYVNIKTHYIDNGFNPTEALNQAILDADDWNSLNPGNMSVLFFPEGDYTFSSQIELKNNIIIKGDGSDKTRFIFNNCGFIIKGNQLDATDELTSQKTILSSEYNGSTKTLQINLENITGPDNKNWFTWLMESENNRFMEIKVPNGNWHKPNEGSINYVGQIVKIQSFTSTSLTFVDDIGLTLYFAGTGTIPASIGRINPKRGVGFEDIKISSTGEGSTHFSFDRAANCWVSGVESYNPGIVHISIAASTYIEIRGCYIHEAKNVCIGGEGYGIVLGNHSTNCLIEDNLFRRLRHSMIACLGANRNVFGYNFSCDRHAEDPDPVLALCIEQNGVEPDLLFHGRFPYANLAEGNVVDGISAEVVHGQNGPYNTIFRNKAKSNLDYSLEFYGGSTGYLYTFSSGGICIKNRTASGYLMSECQYFNVFGNTINDSRAGHDFVAMSCGTEDGYNGENNLQDTPYSDISYYYDQQPQFLVNSGLSWPPVGTRTGYGLLSQTNPAELRWWNQTKKTATGEKYYYVTFINNLSTRGVYFNNHEYGSTKIICFKEGSSITNVTVVNQNNVDGVSYVFQNWQNGNGQNVTSITENCTLYANIEIRPISATISFSAFPPMNNLKLSWDIPNNPNISQYKVYRKSPLYYTNEPQLLATLTRSSSNYIDTDFKVINGTSTFGSNHYDVRPYLSSNNTYSVESWTLFKYLELCGPIYTEKRNDTTMLVLYRTPKEYAVSNYPNPFNPMTTISYSLPNDSHANITIYDRLGKEVDILVNEYHQAGSYRINYDGTKLPSGVYFCRMIAGKYVETKRMLLLK